jgi:hypothetical protein
VTSHSVASAPRAVFVIQWSACRWIAATRASPATNAHVPVGLGHERLQIVLLVHGPAQGLALFEHALKRVGVVGAG